MRISIKNPSPIIKVFRTYVLAEKEAGNLVPLPILGGKKRFIFKADHAIRFLRLHPHMSHYNHANSFFVRQLLKQLNDLPRCIFIQISCWLICKLYPYPLMP